MIDSIRLLNTCKYVDSTKLQFKITRVIPSLKSRKVCFFMHGTSGFSKNCINYMKILHALGFTIVAPDHNAYHHYLCNIHKSHKYCGRHLHFNTTESFAKKNKDLYDYVAKFRKCELESCIKIFKHFVDLKKSIALGVSEGAIAVSLARIPVHAKFICSYSIERNYFTRKFPGIQISKNQRIIQIIGTKDQYFGATDSISANLSPRILGNGIKTFKKHQIQNYTIYLLKNQQHSLLQTSKRNANLLKYIVAKHYMEKYNLKNKIVLL